ncbi:MAG: diphthine synthase [Nanoarchaeota archaeon]
MTFYLIGLGLDLKSISLEALEAIGKCDQIYLENYTVDFPYNSDELEKVLKKKIIKLNREDVESENILGKAKNNDIILLVYGNPLSATTHISLILSAKKNNIKFRIIHAESILTAIAETGLQLYKFGKTASMPKFTKNFEPDSFLETIAQNQKINAHSLLLTDIKLSAKEAIAQLEKVCKNSKINFGKIIICSKLGTRESKIYFNTPEELLKKQIKMPFCIIIPSELHFVEEEALGLLSEH